MPPLAHTRRGTQVAPSLDTLLYARLYCHENFHVVLREAVLLRCTAATHRALTASSSLATQSHLARTSSSPGVPKDVREIAQTQRNWRRQDWNANGPSALSCHYNVSPGDEPDCPSPLRRAPVPRMHTRDMHRLLRSLRAGVVRSVRTGIVGRF